MTEQGHPGDVLVANMDRLFSKREGLCLTGCCACCQTRRALARTALRPLPAERPRWKVEGQQMMGGCCAPVSAELLHPHLLN